MSKHKRPKLTCAYCGKTAKLSMSSAHRYHGRDYGPIWECDPCEAWVGCHPGTTKPLGRLANKELRLAKIAAHDAFDGLWRRKVQKEKCSKSHARSKGYAWLAAQLGISPQQCHIGMFDVAMCRRVVEVCRNPQPQKVAA